jgi:hypothetical protein
MELPPKMELWCDIFCFLCGTSLVSIRVAVQNIFRRAGESPMGNCGDGRGCRAARWRWPAHPPTPAPAGRPTTSTSRAAPGRWRVHCGRRTILAKYIVAMARSGERDTKWLADSALLYLSQQKLSRICPLRELPRIRSSRNSTRLRTLRH